VSIALARHDAPPHADTAHLSVTGLEAAPTQPLSITQVAGLESFMGLQPEWDALVTTTDDQPFYRHEFLRIWLDNFAPRADLRVLLAREHSGKLAAALPLLQTRARLLGMPVRQLASPANDHTPRFDMLAHDSAEAGRMFMEQIGEQRGWDLLLLRDVPPDGAAWGLYSAAQEAGYPAGTWDSLLSPYFEIPASEGEIEARLDAKFRANLRRRRRKLEGRGRVTLERVEGGPHLEARLLESFTLEASGWKGREGTAISQSAETEGFYRELARAASYGGYLALYILRVDGKPVASHYALQQKHSGKGRYLLLKPAYSEAYADCSPGHLLMHEVVRDLAARGEVHEFDFLGPNMEWKRDWAGASARQHRWLFIFNRTPYGRALHTAKFGWAKSRWAKKLKEVAGR
jgi:CelD/BcsL family acetyltransferase involved in cellulose biosynthesis